MTGGPWIVDREFDFPHVVKAERRTRYVSDNDPPEIAHLADKELKQEGSKSTYTLTRCGRRLNWPERVGGRRSADKLCGRCGTEADFEAAWEARRQSEHARYNKSKLEDAERNATLAWNALWVSIENMVTEAFEEAVLAGERMMMPQANPASERGLLVLEDASRLPESHPGIYGPPAAGKLGDLMVWNVVNPPNPGMWYPVASPREAKEKIDAMANAQLKMDWVHSNAFGLVEWDGTEWMEWYSEDGRDIDEWEQEDGTA